MTDSGRASLLHPATRKAVIVMKNCLIGTQGRAVRGPATPTHTVETVRVETSCTESVVFLRGQARDPHERAQRPTALKRNEVGLSLGERRHSGRKAGQEQAAEPAGPKPRLAETSAVRTGAHPQAPRSVQGGGTSAHIVKEGDALAILVPDVSARAVELWVDGNDAPPITSGREVRIQFEGWPAVQFVGWPSVAIETFGGEVAFVDSTDNGEGKFRIVVTQLAGEEWPDSCYLRQGVRANGWVLLNQVSLGYELWRLFNGFPPAVSAPHDASKSSSGGQGGGKVIRTIAQSLVVAIGLMAPARARAAVPLR